MGVLATFDAQGGWGQTHVCDGMLRQNLQPLDARWGKSDAEALQPDAPEGPAGRRVIQVVEGTLLIYLPAGCGHLGLLCEAGEWLDLPTGLGVTLDASAAPDLDLRVWPAGGEDPVSSLQATGQGAGDLPSHGDFIERMLELTGYAAEE